MKLETDVNIYIIIYLYNCMTFNAKFHKTRVIETESLIRLRIDCIFQYAFEFHA